MNFFTRLSNYLGIAVLFVASTSCSGDLSNTSNDRSVNSIEVDSASLPSIDDLEIAIDHSMCRGFCPVYSLHVNGNGDVLFLGERSTSSIGEVKDKLEQDQLIALASEIYSYDYFNLPDDELCTDGFVLDVSAAYLHIKWQGMERTSGPCQMLNVNEPEPVLMLIERLEEIVGTARWVRSN